MIFDFSSQKTYAVLLMAGKGNRIDPDHPKQFIKVADKELFLYAAEVLEKSDSVDFVVYVVPSGEESKTEAIIRREGYEKPHIVIAGAGAREESAKCAIEYLHEKRCNPHSIIMIHDADRPNITSDLIERNIKAAEKAGAAITATKCVDSVVTVNQEGQLEGYVDRSKLACVQTPQTFTYAVIYGAFLRASDLTEYTDEGSLVLKTTLRQPEIVEGSSENFKVTTPADLALFEQARNKQ